jgi:hypothetical protein
MDMEIIKGKQSKDAVELVLNGLFQNMKVWFIFVFISFIPQIKNWFCIYTINK